MATGQWLYRIQHTLAAAALGMFTLGSGIAIAQSTTPAELEEESVNSPAMLTVGDRGETVAILQRLLLSQGEGPLEADGIYGQGTGAIVAQWQTRQGQPPTGTVTLATWGGLWLSPWQGLPENLLQGEVVSAAEQVRTQPVGSPLWLLVMPAIPLLGGGMTYWRRRLQGSGPGIAPEAVPTPKPAPTPLGLHPAVQYFPLWGLATVSLVSFGVYVGVRSQLAAPVQRELVALADQQVKVLDQWFEQQRQALLATAANGGEFPDLIIALRQPGTLPAGQDRLAYEALATTLSELLETRRETLSLSILNNGGIVLFSTDPNREGQYQPIQNTTTYFTADQPEQAPNLYVSPLTDTLQITFATPLLDETGARLGVLALDLNLADLQQRIQNAATRSTLPVASRPTQFSYLVGQVSAVQNQIVAAEALGRSPTGVNSTGIDRAVNGNNGVAQYLNDQKSPVLGAYRWVSRHNLALLAEISQARVFRSAEILARTLFLGGLGGVILLSVLLRYLYPVPPAPPAPDPSPSPVE